MVAGATIEEHEILEDETVVVTYSNGAVVTVDYENETFAVAVNGSEAMSYKAGEAE